MLIGTDPTGEWVHLPDDSRFEGTYLLGLSGSGKSSLLLQMAESDLRAGHGVALIDASDQGKLAEALLNWVPPNRIEDVVLVDLGSDRSVGLNLFDNQGDIARSADGVVQAFHKVWGVGRDASWGPRLANLLHMTALTFIEHGGLTLAEVQRFLAENERPWREEVAARISNETVRGFWDRFHRLRPFERSQWLDPVLNKVEALMADDRLRAIFGQRRSTIDIPGALSGAKILIVKLPAGIIGENATALAGAMLTHRLLLAGQFRPSPEPPFFVYCDEWQRYGTGDIVDFVATARASGIAILVAHQYRGQLEDYARSATRSMKNLMLFNLNADDARELAWEFDTRPTLPPPVKSRDPWGELATRGHPNPNLLASYGAVRERLDEFRQLAVDLAGMSMVNGKWKVDEGWIEPARVQAAVRQLEGMVRELFVRVQPLTPEEALDAVEACAENGAAVLMQVPLRYPWPDLKAHRDELAALWQATFAVSLGALYAALEREPLWAPEWEAEVREGKARSRSDIADEIASALTVLPKYHARVQLHDGKRYQEALIETFEPVEIVNDTPAAIRDRMTAYTRPRAEVLQEIKQRGRTIEIEPVEVETAVIAEQLPDPRRRVRLT